MICETFELLVEGQKTGAARLKTYCQDAHVAGALRRGVLVIPGGGYRHVSPREGEPIALTLAALGYQAFVLEYSVAPNVYPTALLEVERAFEVIRAHAKEWHLDAEKLILMGFSAGGHLALDYVEERPTGSVRPAGLVLGYPVVTSGEKAHCGSFDHVIGEERSEQERAELLERLSLEKHIDAEKIPPVFLWSTWTDASVPVENTLMLASALKAAGVSTELHIFPRGVHGLALANKLTSTDDTRQVEPCVQAWIPLLKTWLEALESNVG